jgi:hypothetical protein
VAVVAVGPAVAEQVVPAVAEQVEQRVLLDPPEL